MSEATWTLTAGALTLRQGDITTAEVDAVVNAANSRLAGGGGVDGAIHRAAGPELLQACQEIVGERGELPAGQAVITPGFNMAADWVIHTVGPVWRGGGHNEAATLRSAYRESLARAEEKSLQSVAFPAISCGAYGYPVDQAAHIALETLRQGLEQGAVSSAVVYLFSPDSFQQWLALAQDSLGEPDN
jgi:O-acetyl-ADP-ribose deacetylase (regulator of RNase III)